MREECLLFLPDIIKADRRLPTPFEPFRSRTDQMAVSDPIADIAQNGRINDTLGHDAHHNA